MEGERLLKAGHIIKCGKDKEISESSGAVKFTAYCLKTSKLKEDNLFGGLSEGTAVVFKRLLFAATSVENRNTIFFYS